MYMLKQDLRWATLCLNHLERMVLTSLDNTDASWDLSGEDGGPTAIIWRKFRDGLETEERLPVFLAECVLASIPDNEPNVARAKIIYRRER